MGLAWEVRGWIHIDNEGNPLTEYHTCQKTSPLLWEPVFDEDGLGGGFQACQLIVHDDTSLGLQPFLTVELAFAVDFDGFGVGVFLEHVIILAHD